MQMRGRQRGATQGAKAGGAKDGAAARAAPSGRYLPSAAKGELAAPALSAGLAWLCRSRARGKLGHLFGKFGGINTGVRQRLRNSPRHTGRTLLDLLSHD
jgi:hypothetical protein